MSNSDRKTIVVLSALLWIAENYGGIESKEYTAYVNKVIDVYVADNPTDDKQIAEMRERLDRLEKRIESLGYTASITLAFAVGYYIAEFFLDYVKTPERLKVWQELKDYCESNQLIKHTAKSNIFEDLDKGEVASNIIFNA